MDDRSGKVKCFVELPGQHAPAYVKVIPWWHISSSDSYSREKDDELGLITLILPAGWWSSLSAHPYRNLLGIKFTNTVTEINL